MALVPATSQFAPEVWVALAALLGLAVGSFLNVVIHRLPRMLEREWQRQCAALSGQEPGPEPAYNLFVPRSSCPQCGHAIRWYENIPLLSFALLKGRCAACAQPIGWRYPLVEAVSALFAGYCVWHFGPTAQAAAASLLLWALLALAMIDLDTHLLPDRITQPLVWGGLLANWQGVFVPLADALIGAVAGYLALWTVYHAFRLATGKEGMGYGDFKLLAALGAWLGWQKLPLIVLASSLMGAVFGLLLIGLAGHDHARPIPFGPWLALGGALALLWGDGLLRLYLGA
ncbi:MAG: A24 family peptidase [Thiobacillaceae bacterium]|nr:A24 family peptidase [Thiobacillaceae bacterium]MDW8323184.1 A24 family peptidase [Burkholderiales bacterium]